ncbi:hypothetical protein [Parabacteroides goldsteinii]|uniref:hypothetical protein n=1 Tax=Parabacteroides goldsteinii TaxID=328812 RepID=UPI0018A051E1|nr:hypothetical protein [Parabacteroides goldsteinii]DAX75786.1 MAG TPA: hypothetical protein [Caudoviricetes sp.]
MKSIGEQFDVGLVKLQQYIDKDIEVGLRRFGDYIIEYAAKSKDPNNRTYNLQDSYGYAIYHDGKIAGMPVMLHNVADEPDTEGGWGTERGKRFLESYRPRVKGWSMAIVAGEFYASFLENEKNLDVLIQAMFHSQDSFMQHFTKMS